MQKQLEKEIFKTCINFVREKKGRRFELISSLNDNHFLHAEIYEDQEQIAGGIILRNGKIVIYSNNKYFEEYFRKSFINN
jgi:hypothetical protein